MTKRPKISDELHAFVHRIHEEYTGSSAGSFEQALETVVHLVETRVAGDEESGDGWLSGTDTGELPGGFPDAGVGRDPAGGTEQSTPEESYGASNIEVSPDIHAVFKTVLEEGRRIDVPDPEARALGLRSGMLLQVIAYPLDEASERDEDDTD